MDFLIGSHVAQFRQMLEAQRQLLEEVRRELQELKALVNSLTRDGFQV